MRVHHFNAVTMCPLGGALMDGRSLGPRGRLVCHCLMAEARDGLVLVDTGFGLRDMANPRERLSAFFRAELAPELRPERALVSQIERMGFDRREVRHIVLTHLDFDHAGGLDDFPEATVHLLAAERDGAMAQRTRLDRMRFRPQQWATRHRWKLYEAGEGEPWFGFDAVRGIPGLDDDVLLVPLVGHTLGHAGVAVRSHAGWLLHTGDAYFFHGEMDVERPWCTPGLRFYQWMMEKDRKLRLWNQERLRALKREHADEIAIFCAHDASEFELLAGGLLEARAEKRRIPVRETVRELEPV
jgi:glyoxylase-like metal-dependent hydrolase (beta-lactamase superfamily II)